MLKTAFNSDPAVIKLYRSGIICHDVRDVQEAITRGVDVNTSWHESLDRHPLQYMFFFNPPKDYVSFDAQRKDAKDRIIDLLLAERVDFTSKDQAGQTVVDRIVGWESRDWPEDKAKVVLAALHDSLVSKRKPFEINFPAIFIEKMKDREEYLQHIGDVLAVVAQRLLDPRTIVEKSLVSDYPEAIAAWKYPAPLPDIETLPQPSAKFKASFARLCDSLEGIDGMISNQIHAYAMGRAPDPYEHTIINEQLSEAKAASAAVTKDTIERRRNPKPKGFS